MAPFKVSPTPKPRLKLNLQVIMPSVRTAREGSADIWTAAKEAPHRFRRLNAKGISSVDGPANYMPCESFPA
jgi:hypothetical protein